MSRIVPQTIFTKTAKGVLETRNKTVRLPHELSLVFLSIDGKATVEKLLPRSGMTAPQFQQALATLVTDGYIQIVSAHPGATGAPEDTLDLDFTSLQETAKLNMDAASRALAEGGARENPQTKPDTAERVRQLNAQVQAMRQEREGVGRASRDAGAVEPKPAETQWQRTNALPSAQLPADAHAAKPSPLEPVEVPPAAPVSARPATSAEPDTASDLPVVDINRAELQVPRPPPIQQTAVERAIGRTAAQAPAGGTTDDAARVPAQAKAASTQAVSPAINAGALIHERPNVDRAAHDIVAASAAARRKAEAAELSRRAAEARRQRQEEEARRAVALKRRKLRKGLMTGSGVGLVAVVAGGIAWLQFTSLTDYIPGAQQTLSQRLNQPVTIASLRYVLLPTPRLVLEGVAIGKTEGVRAKRIDARILPFTLFGDAKHFDIVDAHGVTVHPTMLATIPAWTGARTASAVHVERLRITDVTLDLPKSALAAFGADVTFAPDGALQRAVFSNDKARLELVPQADGVQAIFDASAWKLPFGPGFEFDYLTVKGVLGPAHTATGNFTVKLASGSMQGTMKANWSGTFRLEGEYKVEYMQLAELARALVPEFTAKGTLKATGRYSTQGESAAAALANLQTDAGFTVTRGELTNIDLVRGIQSPGTAAFRGGRTGFDELSGTLTVSGSRYVYRQVQLASGPLNASAALDIAPAGELNGRLNAELAARGTIIARQALTIGGTVKDPQLKR